MIETTEVRWFQDGALPPSVLSWFAQDGVFGTAEERCDLYRIDGRADVGVKLRARSTLELKVRQHAASIRSVDGSDGAVELPPGVAEVWRKWSLADGLVSGGPEPWIAVDKTVVKRRFSITGKEVVVRDLADLPDGPCCDIEVVAIGDRTEQAWSFAFAAHGPRRSRHASIGAAWHTLVSAPPPATWPSVFTASCGYPAWLEQRIGSGSPVAEQ